MDTPDPKATKHPVGDQAATSGENVIRSTMRGLHTRHRENASISDDTARGHSPVAEEMRGRRPLGGASEPCSLTSGVRPPWDPTAVL